MRAVQPEHRTFTPPAEARRAVLPGASLLKLGARNWTELESELQRGLPTGEVLEVLKRASGATAADLASLLGMSPATLHRRTAPRARLSPEESERAYRLARLLERATDVLGSGPEALGWLREPVLGLGNRSPLDAARTELGAELVLQLLGRLEDGVYS